MIDGHGERVFRGTVNQLHRVQVAFDFIPEILPFRYVMQVSPAENLERSRSGQSETIRSLAQHQHTPLSCIYIAIRILPLSSRHAKRLREEIR